MIPSHSKLTTTRNTKCWATFGVITTVGSIVVYFLLLVTSNYSSSTSSDIFVTNVADDFDNVIVKNVSAIDKSLPISSSAEYNNNNNKMTLFPSSLQIAYFGNSILYVNDCPAVLQNMIQAAAAAAANANTIAKTTNYNDNDDNNKLIDLQQEQCLVGGATLTSLWEDRTCKVLVDYVDGEDTNEDGTDDIATFKSGMYHEWDYIIINDQTQSPAREYTREFSIYSIRTRYVPLLLLNKNYGSKPTIPIIIQTAAYRIENVQYSSDLGSFDQFTNSLAIGVEEYKTTFDTAIQKELGTSNNNSSYARIAPVGEAYRFVRNANNELYQKLYSADNYHPSQYGTWLQACVLYIICFQQVPPLFVPTLMSNQQNLPTDDEAEILRQVACQITDIVC